MSGWTTKKLGEVCEIFRGGSPRPIKSFITNEPNGINWIKIGDTDLGGKYISSCAEKIKPSGVQYSRYVERGDFLISNSMSFGRPYILKINGCIHDGWLVIKKYEGTFDQDFLFYLLQSPSVQFQFNDLARGSTVRNLNRELVARVKVHYPETVAEQKRIVAKIDAAFEKIDRLKANAEKNLANAKELFQSALDEAMRPKKGWVEKRLGEVYEITSSKRVFKSEWKTAGVPFYRAREIVKLAANGFVKNELFVSEEMYETYAQKYGIPKAGDIMITGVGTLGVCYVVKEDDKFYFKDGNIIWLKKCSNDVDSKFISLAFSTSPVRKQVLANAGTTVGTYTIIMAKNTVVQMPTIVEQKKIVNYVTSLRRQIETLQQNYARQIADCAEMRQAILREAFEGRL